VFDMADTEPAPNRRRSACREITSTRFRDVFQLQFPEVRTVVGISGHAFPINASTGCGKSTALGERSNIIDPATKKPAVRNIYLDNATLGVKALQARAQSSGSATSRSTRIAGQLAQARQLPVADVRADLLAGLNPGVRLVPSHVMAMEWCRSAA